MRALFNYAGMLLNIDVGEGRIPSPKADVKDRRSYYECRIISEERARGTYG